MSVVLSLVSIAVLALCLLVWLLSRLRDKSGDQAAPALAKPPAQAVAASPKELSSQELPAQAEQAPEGKKDVSFRIQGERGMGGAGDGVLIDA